MSPREPMPVAYEDYVKAIYAHTEWQPDPITPSALAARLGLAASSVTEMVRKLARDGLVTHRPYGAVTLTDEGTGLALRMLRRHRLIETWLVDSFGYDWDEVHDEAEVLEHALSDRLLESIADQLGQPVRDPHGDPIPAADGSVLQPTAVRLRDAAVGHRGRVVRISDRDPGLLRYFASVRLQLDVPVLVRAPVPFRDDLRVTLGAGAGDDAADSDGDAHGSVDLDLGVDAAEAVWLTA
ncbi:metal-dependent transcriptional regulator [Planctomonas psychrotolerans]|uniref:metal-dependent transcriptional regulator n=1 Tax=Planctomonas psychrotolerans TaxID=2528712 RepID=UPI001D0D4790|nr:metal-dependent transcriptional regulator [Planctomonas psychrotolerans]